MKSFIFIDESGDLGCTGKSTKYFVLTCLICQDTSSFDKIIKNMRRQKFKNELIGVNEIKSSQSSLEIRNYMIDKLNNMNGIETVFLGINKEKHRGYMNDRKMNARSMFRDMYTRLKVELQQ